MPRVRQARGRSPTVAFDRDHGLAEWLYAACARAGFTPKLAAQLAEVAAVVRLAAAGLGPAFVPANVVPPGLDAAICSVGGGAGQA
jgi:DNA-binding transcriptional LysR family regulator